MTEKIVTIGEEQYELAVERKGDVWGAGETVIELVSVRGNEAEIRAGERTHFVPFVVQGTIVSFAYDGEIYAAEVTDAAARSRARHRTASMAAPMPGSVLKILTAAGSVVTKGTPLLILEAMKMEHQIIAPYDGQVTAINCKEGELVQPGVDLVTLTKSS
ncbi:MAG: biotin/lipoyl-containing protein [Acidobacteriota bacterium]